MPTVGIIKPSTRPTLPVELIAILPHEIKLLHDACNIHNGTREELDRAFADFETKVAAMAAKKPDLIHTAGVPFLLLGYKGEDELVKRWEQQYGIPVFTNGQSQVNATRAFGAKRIVAASYFAPEINPSFENYLTEAGFEVLNIKGYQIHFQDVPNMPAAAIRKFFDEVFLPHKGKADAFYVIGPAWTASYPMIEELEEAYGIPIIHHIPAQSWEIQRRLGFRHTVPGFGRMARELPGLRGTKGFVPLY